MAKFVMTDTKVLINSVDFSDHITAVTLDIKADEVETTAFGSSYRTRIAGLKDGSIKLSFHNDFGTTGSSALDSTLWSLFGTNATVVVTPGSAAVGPTNPSYSGVYLVSNVAPISGSVGDLATRDVTWMTAGTSGITRATA